MWKIWQPWLGYQPLTRESELALLPEIFRGGTDPIERRKSSLVAALSAVISPDALHSQEHITRVYQLYVQGFYVLCCSFFLHRIPKWNLQSCGCYFKLHTQNQMVCILFVPFFFSVSTTLRCLAFPARALCSVDRTIHLMLSQPKAWKTNFPFDSEIQKRDIALSVIYFVCLTFAYSILFCLYILLLSLSLLLSSFSFMVSFPCSCAGLLVLRAESGNRCWVGQGTIFVCSNTERSSSASWMTS